jgi:hypothetical protein
MTETAKNRIMIFGPKSDGTYLVEFRTSGGQSLPALREEVLRSRRVQRRLCGTGL